MVERYEIADYLTLEEKSRMASQTYSPTYRFRLIAIRINSSGEAECSELWDSPTPETEDGRCPFGILMPRNPIPGPRVVAEWLVLKKRVVDSMGESFGRALQSAFNFIQDWDNGVLNPADLPAALGLQAPPIKEDEWE